jgi:hypothetical protein
MCSRSIGLAMATRNPRRSLVVATSNGTRPPVLSALLPSSPMEKSTFPDVTSSTSTIWRCTVMVTLEKNIEIPEKQKIAKYPYEALELGDSFYVQDGDLGRLCNANYREWRKSGKKFTARKVEGGVRVWRVE